MVKKLKRLLLLPEYIKVNWEHMFKQLPANDKEIVFTLDDEKLYRNDDGSGRYPYLILNMFSEAGYNVYLLKKVDFLAYSRLEKYGRRIYSVKNLKVVSRIPAKTKEKIYVFDTVYENILDLGWKKLTFINLFKPLSCKLGDLTAIPYFLHPNLYKLKQQEKIFLLRKIPRKLRIFFGGNTAVYYSNPVLYRCHQMTRMEGVNTVLELGEKTKIFNSYNELKALIQNNGYLNQCILLKTDDQASSVPATQWLDLVARSDFFLCLSGTDLPLCHNSVESMAVGTIPIISHPDWFPVTLEHKKNAIIYSGKEDLIVKMKEVFAMSESEILQMRRNVYAYYDQHMGAKNFIRKYESQKDNRDTIILHPKLVPTDYETRQGEITMGALKSYFNNDQPLVSIIIPTYNRAKKIEEAINSVIAQTYPKWELIISDDGSTDNTKEVVERLMAIDRRIRLIRNEGNQGAQAARNRGIKSAQGPWIAFLDSDDQWLPDSLQLRLDLALKGDYSVVYSLGYIIYENNRKELYKLPDVSKNSYKGVLGKEGPMFQSLLAKKQLIEKTGYLDETAIAYQEWDTSIRLAKFCSFGFLDTPTFIYDYRTPGAISRSHSRNGRAYADIVRKFFWEMFTHVGAEGMVYHYDSIANWYRQADQTGKFKFYKGLSFLFKCLSPRIVARKITGESYVKRNQTKN